MTQPEYVPIVDAERVRPALRLRTPLHWEAQRPADLPEGAGQPQGEAMGSPGPDQGYALGLVTRFRPRLRLSEGEPRSDVEAGAVALAMRRAGRMGRAPCIFDLEYAFRIFGFLGDAPADLIFWRKELFKGAAHDYWVRRRIASCVLEETLLLSPVEVGASTERWKDLLAPGPKEQAPD